MMAVLLQHVSLHYVFASVVGAWQRCSAQQAVPGLAAHSQSVSSSALMHKVLLWGPQ